MSAGLGVPLYEILSQKRPLLRLAYCVAKTMALLMRHRPDTVICQNPSIVLTVLLLRLRPLLGMKVVIDAHFGGVDASNGSRASQGLLDRCNRRADLVIVKSNPLADFKVLYPHKGGIVWTIKDGIPYRAATLLEDVRGMVKKARAAKK